MKIYEINKLKFYMINREKIDEQVYKNLSEIYEYELNKYDTYKNIIKIIQNIAFYSNCLIFNLYYNDKKIYFSLYDGVEEKNFKYDINNIIRCKKIKKINYETNRRK